MATIVFGGSFNPVHIGHLFMAQAALKQVPNATLIWMPAACSPFKTNQSLADEHHRYAMCKLAAENDPRMQVSDLEFTMEKPSYTVHTIERLRSQKNDNYYFLCGADSFLSLLRWKEIERLSKMVTFLVANREGSSRELLEEQKEKIEQLGGTVLFLPMEECPISSSQLRLALSKGVTQCDFLTPKVLRYIQENSLYRE